MNKLAKAAIAATLAVLANAAVASRGTCYGDVHDGAIEGAIRFPANGPNYEAYGYRYGVQTRFFVHPELADILTDAFAALAVELPNGAKFVVGEIGLQNGGEMKPHKTHRTGTSVDLFFPIMDTEGKSVMYPANDPAKGYGYKLHFAAYDGKSTATDGTSVDFEALGEYLFQLSEAAKKRGFGIDRVVLIKEFEWKLTSTKHGSYFRRNMRFFDDPNDRHDQHLHIDFAIPCKSMRERQS